MMRWIFAGLTALVLGTTSAAAQTGALDQTSPMDESGAGGAQFNVDVDFLVWQQQIRVGFAGQLEGVRLRFLGNAGGSVTVRVRLGEAWTDGPALFESIATMSVSGYETVFVDMSSAVIELSVGDTFVLETQGTNSGVWLIGSYVDPAMGEPLYPEPLFLGPGGFPPGWRHGFETYMLTGPDTCPDLDGDGVVGLQDLALLLANFGVTEGAGFDDGDLDGDGDVELQDLAILLARFGGECT
jgi:hypothetical protein